MTNHSLSQIDLESKTAVCTVCGQTEIHVPKNYDPARSRVSCMQRHRELNLYKKMWSCLSPEERKITRKEKHSLADIDPESQRATCAICGPTDIYPGFERGRARYRCATFYRLLNRAAWLRDFLPPAGESVPLSAIDEKNLAVKGPMSWTDLGQVNSDAWPRPSRPGSRLRSLQAASEKRKAWTGTNTRLIHEYKRSHSCRRCGIRGLEPRRMRFFESPIPPERRIRKLISKLDPEDLLVELEKHDLYCQNCHPLILRAYHKKRPTSQE